jgi:hypothetical protein
MQPLAAVKAKNIGRHIDYGFAVVGICKGVLSSVSDI